MSKRAWAALAASLAVAGQMACGKEFQQSPEGVGVAGIEQSGSEREPPDIVLRRLSFVRLADGRLAARGTAAEASYRQAASRVEASRLAVELPPGAQAPADLGQLKLTAALAEGNHASRTGAGWGGVLADAERGDHAATERVFIDGPQNLVRAPASVTAHGPGYTVSGSSLTASADGRHVRLEGGVKGRLTPAAPPPGALSQPAPVAKTRGKGRKR